MICIHLDSSVDELQKLTEGYQTAAEKAAAAGFDLHELQA